MCGIVGALSFREGGLVDSEARAVHNLSCANIVRGEDGTGVFYQPVKEDKDGIYALWHKDAVSAGALWSRTDAELSMTDVRFAVVHNRAATVGGCTEENTHPFAFGSVIGVHNGTVTGWRRLFPSGKATMDSMAIIEALSKAEPDEDSVIRVLEDIDMGAYSLVWYDNRIRSLRFARNMQRPMCFAITDYALWFGSEADMLEWGVHRAKQKINKMWSNDDNCLITINTDTLDMEYKHYTTYGASYSSYSGCTGSPPLVGPSSHASEWYDSWSCPPERLPPNYGKSGTSTAATCDPGAILVSQARALPELATACGGTRMSMYTVVASMTGCDLVSLKPDGGGLLCSLAEKVCYDFESGELNGQHYIVTYTDGKVEDVLVRPTICYMDTPNKRAYGYVQYRKRILPVHVDLDMIEDLKPVSNAINKAIVNGYLPLLPACSIDGLWLYANGAFGWSLWPSSNMDAEQVISSEQYLRNAHPALNSAQQYGIDHPHRIYRRPDQKVDWDAGWTQTRSLV